MFYKNIVFALSFCATISYEIWRSFKAGRQRFSECVFFPLDSHLSKTPHIPLSPYSLRGKDNPSVTLSRDSSLYTKEPFFSLLAVELHNHNCGHDVSYTFLLHSNYFLPKLQSFLALPSVEFANFSITTFVVTMYLVRFRKVSFRAVSHGGRPRASAGNRLLFKLLNPVISSEAVA